MSTLVTSPGQQIVPAASQVVRLEPIDALVYGGGTSTVLMRGGVMPAGGVRVSVDQPGTSTPPHTFGSPSEAHTSQAL